MSSFEIDTGFAQRPLLERLPDWFLDGYDNAAAMTDARLVHDYGQWLIKNCLRPKMAKTARLHLLAAWWVLPILAEHHPEVFDELLATYAMRVEGLAA